MLLKISKFFLYTSVLSVLVVLNSTFFPFIGGKTYFFRIAIELAFIFFALWWGFEAPAGEVSARMRKLLKQPLFLAVSVFFVVFMLATVFAYDSNAAFWSNYERGEGGFQMLHYYGLFFLAVLLFDEKKDWRRLFWVSVAAAVCMILYGMGAAVFAWNDDKTFDDPTRGFYSNPFSFIGPYSPPYLSPDELSKLSPEEIAKPLPSELEAAKSQAELDSLVRRRINNLTFLGRLFRTERFQGSLGNPAYVAPYLIFSLFYLAWLWVSENKRTLLKNISYGALGVFLAAFFFASQTRGAFVGLVASAFVFLGVLAFQNRAWRKWLVVLIIIAALLFGTLLYYGRSDFVKKLPAARLFDLGISDQTFQTRLWTWNSAWQGFKERPLLGWGPENFSAVFDKYFDPRHFIVGQPSETWFDYAHSVIFDYLSETGILGLLSYLGIFGVFYWEWFRKKLDSQGTALKALIAALPVGYLVQGLALFNVLPIYINIFLFLAFACSQFYPPQRK